METHLHDPEDISIHAFDWSDWLEERETTIAESDWEVPEALTEVDSSFMDTVASIIISGGSDKTSYIITNHIVAANGLEADQSFILKVYHR